MSSTEFCPKAGESLECFVSIKEAEEIKRGLKLDGMPERHT
jgi:hypothetical protein